MNRKLCQRLYALGYANQNETLGFLAPDGSMHRRVIGCLLGTSRAIQTPVFILNSV